MKEKLYIAYGSNLDRRQMARRCPTAEVVCSGMLYGHELLFRGSQFGAVATVEPKPGACVPVLVWKIKPSDERALDLYEGYPHLYEKESVAVRDHAGRQLTVMAYVMTDGDRWRSPALPSEYYYQGIREGYRQNGLPLSKLKQAWQHCAKELDQESSRLNRICGGQAKSPKKQRGKER